MKQKKTLQILLLVFAGLIVLYTGVNLYQKQQSFKEDSDQTMISDLKSLTSISYNNNGTTLSFIKQSGKWYYTKNKKYPITQSSLESLASTFQKLRLSENLKIQMLQVTMALTSQLIQLVSKTKLENP